MVDLSTLNNLRSTVGGAMALNDKGGETTGN